MKIIINYDFFNAVRNVKEPLGPFKIVRNHRKLYTDVMLPISAVLHFAAGSTFPMMIRSYGATVIYMISFELMANFFVSKALGLETDMFGDTAIKKLQELPAKLSDINVRTDYDKLLDSKLYKTKYKVDLNDDKIPVLMQEKFVLVPSYNFGGEETETSILQEHVIGSSDYILSVEEYYKEQKRVLIPNNG